MKHTSGPWKITRQHQSPCAVERQEGGGGAALALVYLADPKTRRRTPEYEANARLIAAAPDLLLELELTHRFLRKHGYNMDGINKVLAKAKGEQE